MQVPLNEPLMEIPYYYPCNFPLIHEVLKRQGSLSSLSLLANSRLYGLPACSDAGLIKTYFNKLDYAESVWLMQGKNEAPSFEKGLAAIRDRLREGELFLATGSSYELPYCEDYHNPRYIEKLVEPGSRQYLVDHWLAVYGMDDGRAYVYDPVPARFAGPVQLGIFESFWRGNKSIPELEAAKRKEELHSFGSVAIAAERKLTEPAYKEALRTALATTAREFLAAREVREGDRSYFFGDAVSRRLLGKLRLVREEGESGDVASLSAFAFDMRWSRYFFRDLLRESEAWLGDPFGALAATFEAVLAEWEQAHKLLQGKAAARGDADSLERFGALVERTMDAELRLYEKLAAEVRSAESFRRRGEAEAARGETEAGAAVVSEVSLGGASAALASEQPQAAFVEANASERTGEPRVEGGAAPASAGLTVESHAAAWPGQSSESGLESGLETAPADRSEPESADRRETVRRIVLDCCGELNADRPGLVPVELGESAPLYGRDGSLDSLGLVSLLASVEQGVLEELGFAVALNEPPAASVAGSPYRSVGTLAGYVLSRIAIASERGEEPAWS